MSVLLRGPGSRTRPRAAARKSTCHPAERGLKLRISGAQILHQSHLVELRAASQQRGDNGNPDAASNISSEVHQSGCGIVLVAWQAGIRGGVDGHEQEGEA